MRHLWGGETVSRGKGPAEMKGVLAEFGGKAIGKATAAA